MGIALVGLGGFLCLLLAFVLERGEMSLNEGWMVGRLTCLLIFVAFALRLRMYQIWIIQYGLWSMGYCGRGEVAKYFWLRECLVRLSLLRFCAPRLRLWL